MTPEQIEAQKAAQANLNARIAQLKECEGKTYIERGTDGKTTYKVLKYSGIGKLANGQSAHLFKVERKNPGLIYTPPATQFLEEHEEVIPTVKPQNKEIL